MTEITSSHNEQLKEIRKLAGRRWRDKLGEFVAEGEDLLEAADAAGWHASARYAATGSGLPGVPVAPHVHGRRLPARLRDAHDRASTRSAGRPPSARAASRSGASATRATWAR